MSASINLPVLVKFAFPRTGSHFFKYMLSGLYDVQLGYIPIQPSKEVEELVEELNPAALYALRLRDCFEARPLVVIYNRNGLHGKPGGYIAGEKTVIVIRDPIATAHSFYRVWEDRWDPDHAHGFNEESLAQNLNEYSAFYDAALDYKAAYPDSTYLLRYEEAVRSPQALEDFVAFLGLEPKLSPSFVWSTTRFENFVNPGKRTFYREGNNDAWRKDTRFVDMLKQVGAFDFCRFGYAGQLLSTPLSPTQASGLSIG
jgi:hypothetical protein